MVDVHFVHVKEHPTLYRAFVLIGAAPDLNSGPGLYTPAAPILLTWEPMAMHRTDPDRMFERPLARPRRTTAPQRIQITDRQLAEKLGVPKDVIKTFKKHGAAHEPTPGEPLCLGLSGMELAAFMALGKLLEKGYVTKQKARRFFGACMLALATDHRHKVLLQVTDANDARECSLIQDNAASDGPSLIAVPEEQAPYTTIYNLSILKNLVRVALTQEPLKLPELGDVECVPHA